MSKESTAPPMGFDEFAIGLKSVLQDMFDMPEPLVQEIEVGVATTVITPGRPVPVLIRMPVTVEMRDWVLETQRKPKPVDGHVEWV